MMVFWAKQGLWVLLVGLIVGQLSGTYSRHAMSRHRRQDGHWWRAHQPVSGLGSFRRAGWGSAGTGFGLSSYSRNLGGDYHSGYDWGSSRMHGGEFGQSRQQPAAHNPASVVCNEDNMVVTVQRDLYGNGKLVKVSDLSLGPQKCKPDATSSDTTVVFTVGLQDCGNIPKMTDDMLLYSTFLSYAPSGASNLPITRTNSAKIDITCYYPRHDNVSSHTIHPTWVPFSSTAISEQKLNFSMYLMNGDWSGPSPSVVFEIGAPLNIEASVDIENHAPMWLLVDRCVATLTSDITQGPSYDIIAYNGCLVDGKQEDSNSAFRTPRVAQNKLQFTVDAFKFADVDSSVIYITCFLRTVSSDVSPGPTNKACSYSKTSNSWLPVEGPNSICSCCESRNCVPTSGSPRQTLRGGARRSWKREATSVLGQQDEEWPATLGPLYIVGADSSKAVQMTGSSLAMEIWMVAGVCSLWLVVVLACILVWKIKPKNTVRPSIQ